MAAASALPVDPRSGFPLSQSVVLNGGTIPMSARARVSSSGGAVSVNAPSGSVYDGACFMVEDSGGVAGTNAITVNGGARTIDGSATFTLSRNYGIAFFVWDTVDLEWKRALVPRLIAGFALPVYLVQDLP